MGRLEHLKRSSELLMQDPRVGLDIHWVLVDFACPQKCGDWAEQTYADRVEVLRIEAKDVANDKGEVKFHKPLALNSGAIHAIAGGAEYLAFLDADTIISPRFLDYLLSALALDNFLIVEPSLQKKDLTGFLALSHRHFIRVGGFDPKFEGWGAEDLEMRVKLLLLGKLPFSELPSELLTSIQHEDDERTANYEEKNKHASHSVNLNLLCSNAFRWTGKHLLELYEGDMGSKIRRLLGIEPMNPRELL